jgi:ribonuclease HI
MNTTAKLFSTLMAAFLSHFCEAQGLLPDHQFGGRPGRMTTDPLHLLVHRVKHAWRNGKVASALFLDVQGAFPNVVKEVLIHNMKSKGVPSACIRLVQHMLTGRKTQLCFDDFTSEPFDITNGNNQGCPLSMVFYAFYNAPLIEVARASNPDELILGFVDDVTLLAFGPTFEDTHNTLRDMMERPGGGFDWSWSHNSPFELSKLALIDFSSKQRNSTNLHLRCRNTGKVTEVKSVKAYKSLGVQLEPNLRWAIHESNALASSSAWVNLIRRLSRISKGISVKLLRQLYIAVAVPRMTYAADLWFTPPYKAKVTSKRRQGSVKFTDKIRSIQRRALITILGSMRTTAGDFLDAHAFVLPVHLLFLKICHRASVRLATLPSSHPLYKPVRRAAKTFVKKHKSSLHHIFHASKVNPARLETILPARRRHSYRPLFKVNSQQSREAAIAHWQADVTHTNKTVIFTDGSGINGKVGAAASLWYNGVKKKTLRFHLGNIDEHTIFEAEAVGVILALHLLNGLSRKVDEALIGLDNQAILQALQNQQPKPGHYLLDKILDLTEDFQMSEARKHGKGVEGYRAGKGVHLNAYGFHEWDYRSVKTFCNLRLGWVPGHEGIQGNEEVDADAKLAAEGDTSPIKELPVFLRRRTLPSSASASKQMYHSTLKSKWEAEWKLSSRYQRLTSIDPSIPSKRFLSATSLLMRNQTSLIIQLRSGHIPLNSHLFRIRKAASPYCPHCGGDTVESVFHFLIHCQQYRHERHILTQKLKRRATSLCYLLSNASAFPHLLKFVHSTSRLQQTFGSVEPTDT